MKFVFFMTAIVLSTQLAQAKTTLWGEAVSIGHGSARSFITLSSKKGPQKLGIALQGSVLEGLPDTEHEYEYLIPLPDTGCLPPFKHIAINWNPHGHEPTEIYGAPHFDFHFYTISKETRDAITCSGPDEALCMKQPATDFIPPFYAPTPAGVPMMGWHWFDTRSPEFNGQPFTSTFIYGFYSGQVAFLEPMITRDFLLTHPDFQSEISVPAKVSTTGYYPDHYKVQYDSVKDFIYITLFNFTKKIAD